MIKTLEELKKATDKELLKMVEDASGSTSTDKFQAKFECEFSYSALTGELTSRGYITGWYKPTEVVTVPMSKDNDRMNLNMTKACKQKYEKFLQDKSFNYVHTTAALERYIDDYNEGRIEVNLRV